MVPTTRRPVRTPGSKRRGSNPIPYNKILSCHGEEVREKKAYNKKYSWCFGVYRAVSQNKGSPIQNTMALILGPPKIVPLILGNHHIGILCPKPLYHIYLNPNYISDFGSIHFRFGSIRVNLFQIWVNLFQIWVNQFQIWVNLFQIGRLGSIYFRFGSIYFIWVNLLQIWVNLFQIWVNQFRFGSIHFR